MAEGSISDNMIEFPYLAHSQPRLGQSDMIRECRESLRKNGHHLAAAPTGIGKTAAAIAAAVEIARTFPSKPHILFLTGRQSQHKIVVDTVRKINSRIDENLNEIKIVDLIGRESMCEVVDIQTGRCLCEQGGTDSSKTRRKDDVKSFILHKPRHVEEVIEKSKQWRVCAWQTCRTVVKDCDILVCDYNHVFAEQVRENSLPSMGISIQNSILIIDEAHNLPDRIRVSMERVITPTVVRNAQFELEEYVGNLELSAAKKSSSKSSETIEEAKLIFELIKLYRTKMTEFFRLQNESISDDEELLVNFNDFTDLIHNVFDEYEGTVGQMKIDNTDQNNRITPKGERLEKFAQALFKVQTELDSEEDSSEPYSHRIAHVLDTIAKYGATSALCLVFSSKGKEGKITNHLLDPGVVSGEIFARCAGSIIMSGTLYPPQMYADVLALPAKLTTKTTYKSPFIGERRPVLIAKDVSTKYNQRNEQMWNKITNHIQALIDNSEGHIALFCPSYSLLSEIINNDSFYGISLIVESRDWSKEDIDKIVEKLKIERMRGNRILLCGVFGARLSEGIDYDEGVLSGVVCVGIPNPPPSVLSNSLKQYIADKFGKDNAWRYTVTQPAINSILQAMGRPIRSIEDRALILLLDRRSADRMYIECYPPNLKMNSTSNPKTTASFASRFFKRVKRI